MAFKDKRPRKQSAESSRQQRERTETSVPPPALEQVATALMTDFDDDGEVYATEIGLQTEQATQEDNVQTARAIEQVRQEFEQQTTPVNERMDEPPRGRQTKSRQRTREQRREPEPRMNVPPSPVPSPEEFERQATTPSSGGSWGLGDGSEQFDVWGGRDG